MPSSLANSLGGCQACWRDKRAKEAQKSTRTARHQRPALNPCRRSPTRVTSGVDNVRVYYVLRTTWCYIGTIPTSSVGKNKMVSPGPSLPSPSHRSAFLHPRAGRVCYPSVNRLHSQPPHFPGGANHVPPVHSDQATSAARLTLPVRHFRSFRPRAGPSVPSAPPAAVHLPSTITTTQVFGSIYSCVVSVLGLGGGEEALGPTVWNEGNKQHLVHTG